MIKDQTPIKYHKLRHFTITNYTFLFLTKKTLNHDKKHHLQRPIWQGRQRQLH